MNNELCVVLSSGGLDSATLLVDLVQSDRYKEILPIHFSYGQSNFVFERICFVRLCKELALDFRTISFDDLFSFWYAEKKLWSYKKLFFEVPFRNLLFLVGACVIGQAKLLSRYGEKFRDGKGFDIAIAVHRHITYEEYWDITPEFIERVQRVYDLSPYRVRVVAPFRFLKKSEIIKRAKDLEYDLFNNTATCYSPHYFKAGEQYCIKPCGSCESCVERDFGSRGKKINEYILKFDYKEAVSNGISPRTLQQVFLD